MVELRQVARQGQLHLRVRPEIIGLRRTPLSKIRPAHSQDGRLRPRRCFVHQGNSGVKKHYSGELVRECPPSGALPSSSCWAPWLLDGKPVRRSSRNSDWSVVFPRARSHVCVFVHESVNERDCLALCLRACVCARGARAPRFLTYLVNIIFTIF